MQAAQRLSASAVPQSIASTSGRVQPRSQPRQLWTYTRRRRLLNCLVKASAENPSGGNDGSQDPRAISLIRRYTGPEYTFVLAGFLKIVTIGGLAYSAPTDAVRSAFGRVSPYLMLPVGLGMCYIAKVIVDSNLQENKRFMTALVAALIFLYFFLYRLLYRYDPRAERVQRTRPVMGGPVAEARARAGDREIGGPGAAYRDSRQYVKGDPRKPSSADDVAYYVGRYPSQLQQAERDAALEAQIPKGTIGEHAGAQDTDNDLATRKVSRSRMPGRRTATQHGSGSRE